MKLIIGGKAQGKLEYAKKAYSVSHIADGSKCTAADMAGSECIYNLQEYIRNNCEGAECELPELREDAVIICDEVGCGIVPMSREERNFREAVGRACIELAERAESVERVFCGIPVRIK